MLHVINIEELIYTILPKDENGEIIKENIKIPFYKIHYIMDSIEASHINIIFDFDAYSLYYFKNKFNSLIKNSVSSDGHYIEILLGDYDGLSDAIKKYKPIKEDELIMQKVCDEFESEIIKNK